MIKKLYTRYSGCLFTILFIMSFYFGYSSQTSRPTVESLSVDKKVEISFDQSVGVVSNNLLLGISLILGFLTANILNYTIVIYNGVIFGASFSHYLSYVDLKTNIIMLLPHGLIEVVWIIGLSSISVQLFFSFVDYVKSDYTNQKFLEILKSRKVLFFSSLIIISLLIELIITPLLINL